MRSLVITGTASEIAKEMFARKERIRKLKAALPIEEKLRRLVVMQQRANEIRRSANRPLMRVWELN
jgi:hypothetical protein